jgi:hypothetical protein
VSELVFLVLQPLSSFIFTGEMIECLIVNEYILLLYGVAKITDVFELVIRRKHLLTVFKHSIA